jgi:hypothetical protein
MRVSCVLVCVQLLVRKAQTSPVPEYVTLNTETLKNVSFVRLPWVTMS